MERFLAFCLLLITLVLLFCTYITYSGAHNLMSNHREIENSILDKSSSDASRTEAS